jgi:DeoD family purine-nucleoside phosphorylase
MAREPIHLQPTAPLAERVLLPGDPGRALLLAQLLLAEPRMFNHNRGLWGYTGAAADGAPLTIQSTGMGGPSAAIVLEELADLGVRRAVRVGTCGALAPELGFGDLVVAGEAIAADGTSRALGAGERVAADAGLVDGLAGAAGARGHVGAVATTDLFYDPDGDRASAWRAAGALAVEMETAALLRVGALRGVATASVLAVTDLLGDGDRRRIGDDDLVAAGERVGRAGAAALLQA